MKILRVINSMNPASGGPCQGIRNSIPELEKLCVQNEVVCLDDPKATFLGGDTFPVYALGPGKGPWQYASKLMPWLLRNLAKYDVVIVHGLWQYHSYATHKAIRLLKKRYQSPILPKIFIMPHGMLDPYFQRAPERRLKALRNIIYWKLIEREVVNEATGVLFTCDSELLLARIPFRPYKPKQEVNVGYGVADPPPYDFAMRNAFLKKCEALYNQHYILFLGRIHRKKGVDILIDAYEKAVSELMKGGEYVIGKSGGLVELERVAQHSPYLPKLVIAGPGLETAFGKEIKMRVCESQVLMQNVFFPGMLTGNAKWGAFYGCDAFVLPSHQENFGIAVVEALACCKPILISKEINIWREIEVRGGAIVAEDTLSGTHKMLMAWEKLPPDRKINMSIQARRAYEDLFSIRQAAVDLKKAVLA
ncbi:glycosyltransferase [Pontibacter saemangeumensis]|uniref:Glycosyltransferase n=1 Tax=Pontibacter saemangeumensis TaxID=1084525 RepID=A0ABP8LZG3_9BACT